MGFYWTTYLYHGKIVEIDTEYYNELKEKNIKFMVIDKKNIMFYDKKIIMGSIDPVLGKDEIIQGYVDIDELERWFSVSLSKKQEWDNQSIDSKYNFDMFIAQVGWNTYGNDGYLEYNLPVISNK